MIQTTQPTLDAPQMRRQPAGGNVLESATNHLQERSAAQSRLISAGGSRCA